jgi:hypothetical protein
MNELTFIGIMIIVITLNASAMTKDEDRGITLKIFSGLFIAAGLILLGIGQGVIQ